MPCFWLDPKVQGGASSGAVERQAIDITMSIAMSNSPFTLDMFGNSALSSGFGLGVTAFGSFDPVSANTNTNTNANDEDPDPMWSAPVSLRDTAPAHWCRI